MSSVSRSGADEAPVSGNIRDIAGRAFAVWTLVALLNMASQVVFRRVLLPGEFATLNTLLGAIDFACVPVFALTLALHQFQGRESSPAQKNVLAQGRGPLMQVFVLGWSFVCALLFLPLLDFLWLPRFLAGLFALPCVFLGAASYWSFTICEQKNRLKFWCFLLGLAAFVRLFAAWLLAGHEPWAEAGLGASFLAGLVLLTPGLREAGRKSAGVPAQALLRDREFRLYFFATLSVTLALFLFGNADRMVAQRSFGNPEGNSLAFVQWGTFDAYQTAGLLGRSLLWGTQPLLLLLLIGRTGQKHTSPAVRNLFWSYVGILLAASALLRILALPLSHLFGGENEAVTAYFLPSFALAMLPLGLLQVVGIFALASRRYPECFTLGGASVVYTLLLAAIGKPQLMLSYMFGGGTVALLLILFLGVVRWGRKQP